MAATVNNNTYATINTLFYLLYARYGNSSIASNDISQFKYKLWTIIFQYGGAWQKRLDIQKNLQEMSLEEYITVNGVTVLNPLFSGSKQIYNHAMNPSTAPSTDTMTPLTKIDDQSVTNNKRGLLESYNSLETLLKTDVTEAFLDKFKKLFIKVVTPEKALYYGEDGDTLTDCGGYTVYGGYRNMTFTEIFTDPDELLDNEHYFISEYESAKIPCILPKTGV